MRLWHQNIISKLPKAQLLGQHRECCALRGKGWGKKHSTVDYVFLYNPYRLYFYHLLVMAEMVRRGYEPIRSWFYPRYRGQGCEPYSLEELEVKEFSSIIYPQHDNTYLQECVDNLKGKGIVLELN